MRRILTSTLVLGLFCSTAGLIGCGEESGVKTETTATGPDGGTTTKTSETKTETSGGGAAPATGTTPSTTP